MTLRTTWIKSSYSGTQGGNCVEVAISPRTIRVRDSKIPSTPHLSLSPTAWTTFLGRERTNPR